MSDKESITHKEFMRRQTQVLTQVTLERVIAAFVASLRTAPLVYRSTLVSWSRLALMPHHSLIDLGDNHGCSVCGVREANTIITEELLSQKHSGSCIVYP